VDVRTEDGQDAGSLFVEMLKGMGARILARVGQSCTHIVFKDGLMSTLTRYRLLNEPKPFVVGIAWVVESVERRTRLDEADYAVDLEDMNIAGTNKRRKSMLPKLISVDANGPGNMSAYPSAEGQEEGKEDNGDQSMESSSSIILGDGLTPLERARRRTSLAPGPRQTVMERFL